MATFQTRRIAHRPPELEAQSAIKRRQAGKPLRTPRARRIVGFALSVLLPLFAVTLYMTAFARPQFVSTVAFTVRSSETVGVNDALSGIARITGAPRSADAVILAAFLESQTLVERLNERLDLVRHYAAPYGRDPLFALSPNATVEARLSHWQHALRVENDPATGLLELQVHAYSPEMAQLIARELLVESRTLLNGLNADMRDAATRQTRAEYEAARDQLARARAALTEFRTESRLFDPNSDFDGRLGVLRLLQGQLAEALVEQDIRGTGTDGADAPRVVALRDRIDAERDRLLLGPEEQGLDYPELLATHERLTLERDYAELAYRNARSALDLTLAEAARNDLFLAVYVQPTLPETADHARTAQVIGFAALFLCLSWTIGTLLRAAVLDRR